MKLVSFVSMLELLKRGSPFKPHKYILLLAVLELIHSREIVENKIYFDDKLKTVFTKYFEVYSNKGDRNRPHAPFFHLKSSGFWSLAAKEGKEGQLASLGTVGGPRELKDNVDYAYLNESVYTYLNNDTYFKMIRNKIVSILEHKDKPQELNLYEEKCGYAANNNKSLFQHEKRAIQEIFDLIKPIGRIVNNVHLYDEQSNSYFKYDLILVAHLGIYVVELKHWSGYIEILPYKWVVNRIHLRPDPHKGNGLKCRILKGIYEHNFRTYPSIWVESVVVLTNQDSVVVGASSPKDAAEKGMQNPTFVSIMDFINYLKKRELASKPVLDDMQIQSVIDYLEGLNNPRPSLRYDVPGYETVEYISQRPECVELVARAVSGKAKGLNRFRVFRIPYQIEQQEKERLIKKAFNTVNAVSQIEDHPHIHKVWVIKNENGDIIEGSEWSETGTLQDLIREQRGRCSADEINDICQGIALALSKAHEVGVIHRALKPENVLMMNNIPKLINFDLAYQIEENHLTVIADVSGLKDDGYIAPEVLFGQDIDEGTDYFGLGIIAYELFTGEKPFASTREFVARGGVLSQQSLQKLVESGATEGAKKAIKEMLLANRQTRLKDSHVILSAFKPKIKKGEEHPVLNAVLQPGSLYDVYEIVKLIDIGATAQIYTAKTVRQKLVVLKLFNKEIPRERIFREAEISSAVQSAYVAHCDNMGHWHEDRFFLVMDLIDGKTLRKMIDRGERPDLRTFRTIVLSLMDALEAFHSHKDEEGNPSPFLHSDIKPENIMIAGDQKPILIDFGAAGQPRIDIFEGTSGYVPPDSIVGTDMKFSQDGDLYALGITLWEWIFGKKPYENPAIGDIAPVPNGLCTDLEDYVHTWLLKAIATSANERFTTIQEMRTAFISVGLAGSPTAPELDAPEVTILEPKDETTDLLSGSIKNPFVPYLNTLSNTSANNENATAESQIGQPFFKRIAVNNPLTDFVYQKFTHEKSNIILTGNAGDGKTTIAADIYTKITGKPCTELNKIEEQGKFVIVKDMSELFEAERRKILSEAVCNEAKCFLIVSNTGTLLESFKDLVLGRQKADRSELLRALEADAPQKVFNDRFVILNIGRMDSIDTAVNVFRRMVDKANWKKCSECTCSRDCAILYNVNLLQDNIETVCTRVTLLYRRLYEYNIRLTMRQMTGHLAYAITSGYNCRDIVNLSDIARQELIFSTLFFNRFFGDNGKDVQIEALQLQPIQQIRKVSFGAVLHPFFERTTWATDKNIHSLNDSSYAVLQRLNKQYEITNSDYRQQVRRLIYFLKSNGSSEMEDYIMVFLQSPMLLGFLQFTSGIERIPALLENNYRSRVMQVLQEYFSGIRLPEGAWKANDLYITLNRRFVGSGTQMILASLRSEDFELKIKPKYEVLGSNRGLLCLSYKHGEAEMRLDLPFLDYVERRYQGEIAKELSAYYTNRIEQFKVKLLNLYQNNNKNNNSNRLRLLRLDNNRTLNVVQIILSENGLEVLS